MSLVPVVVLSYLLGALPFSLWAGRLARGIDLRAHGSGNLGATNVLRVLGWKVALPVLALDVAKGAAAVLLATPVATASARLTHSHAGPLVSELTAAVAAVLGHMWTPFASFRGGKGVATAAGAFGALTPLATAAAIGVFLATLAVSRFVSLGSILAALCFPWLVAVGEHGARRLPLVVLATTIALLIIVRHRANIRRLVAGTESRIGRAAASREDVRE